MERLCLSLLSRQPWVHGRHLPMTLPDLDSRPLWGDLGGLGARGFPLPRPTSLPTGAASLAEQTVAGAGAIARWGGWGVSLALPWGLPGRKQGLPVSSAGRKVLGCRYELLRVLGFPIRGEVLNVLARLCN